MKNYLIIALAGLMVSCGPDSAESPKTEAQTVTTAATDILSISRQGNPDGRTVVLIPGLASSSEVWSDTAASLGEYDLRIVSISGFAGTSKYVPAGSYTDAMVQSIHKHLVDVPGKDTTIIGHSMGGFVALKAMISDTSLAKELIIVDSLPFLAEIFMPGSTPEQAAQSAPMIARQMAAAPRASFDRQQVAGIPRLAKTKSFHSTLTEWGRTSDQSTVALVMGELLATDLRADIAKIDVKINILAAHDEMMGVPTSQIKDLYSSQYKHAPNHELTVVEDSFHFIMIDQPERFTSLVRTDLSD